MRSKVVSLFLALSFILVFILASISWGQLDIVKDVKEFESWKVLKAGRCNVGHMHFILEKDGQKVNIATIFEVLAKNLKVDKKLPVVKFFNMNWYMLAYAFEKDGYKYLVEWDIEKQVWKQKRKPCPKTTG